MKSNRW